MAISMDTIGVLYRYRGELRSALRLRLQSLFVTITDCWLLKPYDDNWNCITDGVPGTDATPVRWLITAGDDSNPKFIMAHPVYIIVTVTDDRIYSGYMHYARQLGPSQVKRQHGRQSNYLGDQSKTHRPKGLYTQIENFEQNIYTCRERKREISMPSDPAISCYSACSRIIRNILVFPSQMHGALLVIHSSDCIQRNNAVMYLWYYSKSPEVPI